MDAVATDEKLGRARKGGLSESCDVLFHEYLQRFFGHGGESMYVDIHLDVAVPPTRAATVVLRLLGSNIS